MLIPTASFPPRPVAPVAADTLLALGRKGLGESFELLFQPDAITGALSRLPGRRQPIDDTASVRIGHHFLSATPKVIDDFSGSTLLSALRVLQKIRNLDGPDDIASALPAAFSKADQPYVEIGLLGLLFPLVAISAVGAVRNALHVYAVEYPDTKQKKLDQQQAMIDALGRDGVTLGGQCVRGETGDELALLATLQRQSVARFQAQQGSRKRGLAHLAWHNMGNRLHRVAGSGDLSVAFNEEVARIMARRMSDARTLASVDTTYQFERLEKRERERHAAKAGRTAALFTGTGMPTMAAGMPVSASAALARALKSTVAEMALEQATGFVMGAAQGMQLTSGALQLHLQRRGRQQIGREMDAVRELDEAHDGISQQAQQLYLDEARFQQADASRGMVFSAMLTGGQGLMLASSATNFFAPPVAAGLAVPGAVMTVAASVGSSLLGDHRGCHSGADAIPQVRARESIGDLGPRLQGEGLAATTAAVGEGSVGQQKQVEQTRMWNDIVDALAKENPLSGQAPCSAAQRRDRVADNNRSLRGRSHIGPDCVQALDDLRQQHYPLQFFQRSLSDIHRALTREMKEHPHARAVARLKKFRQQVLFATLKALSKAPGSANSPLFHHASGRRVNRISADAEFFAYLAANPPADAVFRQKYNEALARHLIPGDRFARDEHHEALTDLARTRQRRHAMADSAGLDRDVATTCVPACARPDLRGSVR